jgi:hypothetical protein
MKNKNEIIIINDKTQYQNKVKNPFTEAQKEAKK